MQASSHSTLLALLLVGCSAQSVQCGASQLATQCSFLDESGDERGCLSSCVLGGTDAVALADAMATNESLLLATLSMSGLDIGDAGGAALAVSVRPTSVRHVDLSSAGMGALSSEAWAATLRVHTSLRRLELAWNGLGDSGVAKIGAAMGSNDALEEMGLERTGCGDLGAAALGSSLGSNTRLRSLSLEANAVGAAGARGIAEGLHSNVALERLSLSLNPIGDEVRVAAGRTSSAHAPPSAPSSV